MRMRTEASSPVGAPLQCCLQWLDSPARSNGDHERRLAGRCVMQWRLVVHKRRALLLAETRAKEVIRTLRIRNVLEGGLARIALSRISDAAETGLWLRTEHNNSGLAVSSRIDTLLRDAEARSDATMKREEGVACETPKQLKTRGNEQLTVSHREIEGLRCLKEASLLLSASKHDGVESQLEPMLEPRPQSANLSPLDLIRNHVGDAGASMDSGGEVHVPKLIELADSFEPVRKSHETDDALADSTLPPEEPDDYPDALRTADDLDDALPRDTLLDGDDRDEFLQAVTSLAVVGASEDSGKSFAEAVAETTRADLSEMKDEIDRSLERVQSSETHLVDYRDYIEKKKRQRSQCLRDLKTHCCVCRGPHITKPPFSMGKDYRREPTHEIRKNKDCLFLKKKRRELRWLDETLAKYAANNKRFEREIARLSRETDRRRNDLRQALRNSFLLMEMASEE